MDFNFKTELEKVKNAKKYRDIWGYYAEKFLQKVIAEIKNSKKIIFEDSEVIEKISFSIFYNPKLDFVHVSLLNKENIEIECICDNFNFKNREDTSNFSKAIKEKLKNDGFNVIDLPSTRPISEFYEAFYIEI